MPTETLAPAACADLARPRLASRRMIIALVLAALLLRVGLMLATRAYTFPPKAPIHDPVRQGWYFGYEVGRVARAISAGEGFASPFHGSTGPTAWLAPLYPYLLAGVFRVFGTYTRMAGVVILTLNSLFAALTCIPILLIAGRVVGRHGALWAAWLWAALPLFFWFAIGWAWETSLSTLLLLTVLWLSLRLNSDWRGWFACGLLWGLIALTNPSLLAILPFTLLWAAMGSGARLSRRAAHAGLAVGVIALTMLPWIVRNHRVFGQWMFVRGNFWAEVSYGNAEPARGIWLGWTHPSMNDIELARYRQLGEVRYVAERKRAALGFLRRHPAFFADLSVRRFFLFWCGIPENWSDDLSAHEVLVRQWPQICFAALAWSGLVLLWRRRAAHAWFLAPALLVYPALYCLTYPDPRYRHPIEPVMLILAVYAVAATRRQDPSQKPAR